MLINFTVGNFLSIKDKITLSLVKAPITEHEDTNVFKATKHLDLLKSAAIYGANASGKSNLWKAMAVFKLVIHNSVIDSNKNDMKYHLPFQFNESTQGKPTFFECVFLVNSITYRYGFEFDNKKISSEWLYSVNQKTETYLFLRENDIVEINSKAFPEGKDLEKRTNEKALFLTVCAQFNGKISHSILQYFHLYIVLDADKDAHQKEKTINYIASNEDCHEFFNNFFKMLDLGFEKISVEKSDRSEKIKTHHKSYDQKNQFINFVSVPSDVYESAGTQKLINIAPIFHFMQKNQLVVILDELNTRLHPILTKALIKLFHSEKTNPHNSQLIFTTHDTNLLSSDLLRRDQIWFTEKNEYGETDLYSLVEYKIENSKSVRKDANFEKNYIQGRYGAIPFLGDFYSLMKDDNNG